MYGDLATRNHQGPWFNTGSALGSIHTLALGFGNPCALSSLGSIGLRTINGLQAIGGVLNAEENLQNGNYLMAGLDTLGVLGNVSAMLKA
jgi:hypothetical protein